MKVIVDTSVWIDHIQRSDAELSALLAERSVWVHPVVLGELACGNFRRRAEVLGNLKILPRAPEAELDEILEMIEARKLHGKGLGYGDAQILASALLAGARLLTRDHALRAAARQLGVAT